MEEMEKEDIMKCPKCGKKFVQESEYTWEYDCKCPLKEFRENVRLTFL